MADSNAAATEGAGPSKMTVSETDVAIELIGMNKWYGDFTFSVTSTSRSCAASAS
jgi:general L-amino acid transport system ATP-binding protein